MDQVTLRRKRSPPTTVAGEACIDCGRLPPSTVATVEGGSAFGAAAATFDSGVRLTEVLTLAGLEPAIFGSEDQRLIH